jgi:hypothetical protein
MCADTLSISIVRNLSNTLYEKRKVGALEVEAAVRELRQQGDYVRTSLLGFEGVCSERMFRPSSSG